MTITTEVTSAFKEAGYASSEESDTHIKDTHRQPSKRDKSDSGFNSSDDNDSASSKSDSNSQPITWTDASGAEKSKNQETHVDTAANSAPLPENLSDGAAEFLRFLMAGAKVGLSDDSKVPIDKVPEWFDPQKYKLGQQFAQSYYFGVNFAEMVSLYLLFVPGRSLEPLIYTGNSHTPYKAFKRYLSTALRVKTWIDCDIWNSDTAGFKNLRTVRALHLNVSKKVNSVARSEIERLGTMTGEPGKTGVWCPMYEGIKKDVESSCPFASALKQIDDRNLIEEALEAEKNMMYFSQTAMSLTQFGFVGLLILYPGKFGAGSATEEELEGFAHLWRSIGYLLGVEDDFNFCGGTLSEVRQRCAYSIDLFFRPQLLCVSEDWEHMSRCMAEGVSYYMPGVSFEVSFTYLCWVLDVKVPSVSSKLNFYQKCMFALTKLFMCHTSKIPVVLRYHNYLLNKALDKVQKAPKEWHNKLENKKYDFQKNKNQEKFAQINDELAA